MPGIMNGELSQQAQMYQLPYLRGVERAGYSAADLLQATAPRPRDCDHATFTLSTGREVDSYRFTNRPEHVVVEPGELPRPGKGGDRFSPDVTPAELAVMTFLMTFKARAYGLPFFGSKGGAAVDPSTLTPHERRELNFKRARFHGYSPFVDVGATDKNTLTTDMADMAESLLKAGLGYRALASFTGLPARLYGKPKLRDPATGEGASMVTSAWLQEEAMLDPALKKTMENGGTVTAIRQGDGKAGRPFGWKPPRHVREVAVLERNGGVRAKKGHYLDPHLVTDLARHSQLGPDTPLPTEYEWVSPEDFWATPADLAVPAAGDRLITPAVVRQFRGIKAIIGIANDPFHPTVLEQGLGGIESIDDVLANAPGVTGSYFEWAQATRRVEPGVRVPTEDLKDPVNAWRQRVRSSAAVVFRETRRLRQSTVENYTADDGDVRDRVPIAEAIGKLYGPAVIEDYRRFSEVA